MSSTTRRSLLSNWQLLSSLDIFLITSKRQHTICDRVKIFWTDINLSQNAEELVLEAVGELSVDETQQTVTFSITPQYAARNPRHSAPRLELCGVDLLFSWKAPLQGEEAGPFSMHCPLPYMSTLNVVTSRFVALLIRLVPFLHASRTTHIRRRYPLVFGSWCKVLTLVGEAFSKP